MGTIRKSLEERLCSQGMFDDQAKEVMDIVVADTSNKEMNGRWEGNIESYPPVILNVLWFSVQDAALKYIDEKCPQAWFRPMFDRNDPIHK